MTRPMSRYCEICELVPPVFGIGFPLRPGALPGLPDYLRGSCIWVCDSQSCERAAKARAQKAAARYGIELEQVFRFFSLTAEPRPQGGH